ncbi:hypothetical protein QQX98_012149 [Neonectria punicea]|uniref:Protein kinase domain-containing protein n=1 Tax=Neonectria punicea TaxID=979145 RepID=A0ABR1GJM6_9HYPO
MVYGQNCKIHIASYEFVLAWPKDATVDSLKELAERDYRLSSERASQLRSRDQPDSFHESELNSWHMTRLRTNPEHTIKEIPELRQFIGSGQYGKVYKTVDRKSGNNLAVKVINLHDRNDKEHLRATIQREIKVLEQVHHEHIIEYLGQAHFHTDCPQLFMPLREGNLTSLANTVERSSHDELCFQVLEQMLKALDYLAFTNFCHRDLKPDNILYKRLGGDRFHFQLTDFGLANWCRLATTDCGTGISKAPELYPEYGRFPQTPKLDIWSLFATILATHSRFVFPPLRATRYSEVLQAVRGNVTRLPDLRHMAVENPERRASAAQMLIALFEGSGLTTPRAKVLPLVEEEESRTPTTRGQRQRQVSGFPSPASGFPSPASRFPSPASRFPSPASRFPSPASRFPSLASRFSSPASRFPSSARQL